MKGFLRKFKPVHWLYNLLHYRELMHNKKAFEAYGIHKPLFATLSAKDFPDKESRAWLDVNNAAEVAAQNPAFKNFDETIQNKITAWSDKGFMVLEKYFGEHTCDAINKEIDDLLASKKIKFENRNKIMFANKKSDLIRNITLNKGLCSILSFLLDREVVPFQTINFITGSGQRGHSDSIHMTTYPLGYLIAAWVALEDVNTDNGPLFYYPGSHKLPYVLNNDFNTGASSLFTGKKEYTDYEDIMEKITVEKGFVKETFLAKKGDVFIWHANLVHGGAPIINEKLTRKSMVIHYFAKDVIKYHEITERPSLLKL